MIVRAFTGGGFAENGYLAVCEASGTAVAVDPGAASGAMARAVDEEGLELAAILLTHAHLDHVEGVHRVREVAPAAPIWLHPADRSLYDAIPQQAQAFGMPFTPQPPPDEELAHGGSFTFGTCTFDVRHTPGHAPGHVIFHAPAHRVALVGDVVFRGSIGRTDLPGGDYATLMRSIRSEILPLPDETVLYTGHGPETTVGEERRSNPFLVGLGEGAGR